MNFISYVNNPKEELNLNQTKKINNLVKNIEDLH